MLLVYVGVGSNTGDRKATIAKARQSLSARPDIRVERVSRLYETEPVGGPPQGKYLNGVFEIATSLAPCELLRVLKEVEKQLGRSDRRKNYPRPIDLDILFYGSEILSEGDVTIPHPRLAERFFVLKPLADLAPDWIHPQLGRTVRELLSAVTVQV